jgi:hypothetical protein
MPVNSRTRRFYALISQNDFVLQSRTVGTRTKYYTEFNLDRIQDRHSLKFARNLEDICENMTCISLAVLEIVPSRSSLFLACAASIGCHRPVSAFEARVHKIALVDAIPPNEVDPIGPDDLNFISPSSCHARFSHPAASNQ